MRHLFDGMSVLHRFNVSQGKATYQNRILQSETYLQSKEANRLVVGQFATVAGPDPCKSILGR
jgi:beta,beta-carotene 9',10'-dioxygenase